MKKHALIVFTGCIGSGKSTIKKKLCQILETKQIIFHVISGKNDLYIPFAKSKGLISGVSHNREKMHLIMQVLYKNYGKDLGTKLLIKYLKKNSYEPVYILDSKRNPEGIRALKKIKDINVIIVGVAASTDILVKRIKDRKRKSDQIKGKNPSRILIKEENIFSLSESLKETTFFIDNTHLSKREIGIICWKIVRTLNSKDNILYKNPIPPRAVNILKSKKILSLKNIKDLSREIKSLFPKQQYVVIQGGNKYLAFLLGQDGNQVINLKITALTKSPFYVLLNSILLERERMATLSENEVTILLKNIQAQYPPLEKRLISHLRKSGFSLENALRYGNRSWLIEVICQFFKIPIPFNTNSSDDNRQDDFELIKNCVVRDFAELKFLRLLLEPIFCGTDIYSKLLKSKIVCIDDILYRGRTLWTTVIIFDLFGIPRNKWKFVTLCSYPDSSKIDLPQTIILKPNQYYPFENSPLTERGYWYTNLHYFSWCSLDEYYAFLLDATDHLDKKFIQEMHSCWLGIMKQFVKNMPQQNLSDLVIQSLIELFCYSHMEKCKLNIAAILDQRAENLSYCIPFVKYLQQSINQIFSSEERKNYNKLVSENLEFLFLKQRLEDRDLKKCFDFYAKHRDLLDVSYLSINLN